MFIALSVTCPLFHLGNRMYLQDLLSMVADGQHVLASPDLGKLAEVAPPDQIELFRDFLTKATKLAANAPSIHAPKNCATCEPSTLTKYLRRPLIVIVENASTDGAFLQEVSRAMGRHHLWTALRKGDHVDIRQAGGISEIPKVLRLYLRTAPNPPVGMRARIVAVADSDCSEATGAMSEAAAQIVKACSHSAIYHHVWKKRSIENYLGDEDLRRYVNIRRERQEKFRQLAELSSEQRDRVRVKEYLGDFMHDLLSCMSREGLSRRALEERNGHEEIEALLTELENLL